MRSFGELLVFFTERAGISDSELARATGVGRQTIFRWKEGLVARPRYREDVLRIAAKLRLAPAERDELLLAAGFPPESNAPLPASEAVQPPAIPPANGHTVVAAPPVLAAEHAAGESPAAGHAAEEHAADQPVTDQPVTEHAGHDHAANEHAGSEYAFTDRAAAVQGVEEAPPLAVAPRSPAPERLIPRPGLLLGAAVLLMLLVAAAGYFLLPLIFGPRSVQTPTPVPVTLSAPTSEPPATPVPATPIVAAAGEKLLLVAPFVGYTSEELRFNVAGRIEESLEREIAELALDDVRVAVLPMPVTAQAQARSVLAQSQASAIIWGEYDAGRVRANVTAPETVSEGEANWTNPVDSPARLALVINDAVPNAARMLALYALGRLYQQEEDWPHSLRTFDKALALEPQDPVMLASLHFYIGNLLPKVRGLETPVLTQAIDHFTQALAYQPDWENLLYNRGTLYLGRALLSPVERGDLDAAITDLTGVIVRQPQRVDPLLNRGIAYYERDGAGDPARAQADFSRAIALAPESYRGYYHRSLSKIRAADPSWPADLLAAAERQPDEPAIQNGLCWGYALDGDAAAALPYCDQAVAGDPSGSSFDGRAMALGQLERYDEAAADLALYLAWVKAERPTLYAKMHGPEAEGWITALQAGENPFTAEVRAGLR